MYREQYGEDVTWSYGVEGWGRIKKTILIKKFDLTIQKQNFESQRILFITFL